MTKLPNTIHDQKRPHDQTPNESKCFLAFYGIVTQDIINVSSHGCDERDTCFKSRKRKHHSNKLKKTLKIRRKEHHFEQEKQEQHLSKKERKYCLTKRNIVRLKRTSL
jgi:hypothetical protein